MTPARVLMAGVLWRLFGRRASAATLLEAFAADNEQNRVLAGMSLVRAGGRTFDLIESEIAAGRASPRVLRLLPDIDRFNFHELPAGTAFGRVRESGFRPFEVRDERGQEVSARFFEINGHWIQTRSPVMPSMLTLDRSIIKQDCLCYLMERLPLG